MQSAWRGLAFERLCLQHLGVQDGQFVIAHRYVEGYEHPHAKAMCMGAEPLYLFDGVTGRLARPEIGPRNIHGIGTAINCCDADVCISGRSQ